MKLIVGISVTWQLRGQTWWMYSQGITFGILPTMSARRENFIIWPKQQDLVITATRCIPSLSLIAVSDLQTGSQTRESARRW
jgi:hypothetical protein